MPSCRFSPLIIVSAVLALVVSVTATSARADMEDGMTAYRAGEYAAALTEFHSLAARGDAEAEFMLGAQYFYGQGVTRDLSIAALWFYKSALQGHASAQLAFGSLHIRGDGVSQDLVKAYMWLQLAAESDVEALLPQAALLRDEASEYMSAEQLALAGSLVQDWRPTPAGFVR